MPFGLYGLVAQSVIIQPVKQKQKSDVNRHSGPEPELIFYLSRFG